MIKRYREAGGHTLEDVALAVHLTFGAVSQWENGRTHPRRATAFKLDEFLQADGAIVAALGYARPTSEGTGSGTIRDLGRPSQSGREPDDHLADVLARLEALERDVASLQESRLSLGDGEPEMPHNATAGYE